MSALFSAGVFFSCSEAGLGNFAGLFNTGDKSESVEEGGETKVYVYLKWKRYVGLNKFKQPLIYGDKILHIAMFDWREGYEELYVISTKRGNSFGTYREVGGHIGTL